MSWLYKCSACPDYIFFIMLSKAVKCKVQIPISVVIDSFLRGVYICSFMEHVVSLIFQNSLILFLFVSIGYEKIQNEWKPTKNVFHGELNENLSECRNLLLGRQYLINSYCTSNRSFASFLTFWSSSSCSSLLFPCSRLIKMCWKWPLVSFLTSSSKDLLKSENIE